MLIRVNPFLGPVPFVSFNIMTLPMCYGTFQVAVELWQQAMAETAGKDQAMVASGGERPFQGWEKEAAGRRSRSASRRALRKILFFQTARLAARPLPVYLGVSSCRTRAAASWRDHRPQASVHRRIASEATRGGNASGSPKCWARGGVRALVSERHAFLARRRVAAWRQRKCRGES